MLLLPGWRRGLRLPALVSALMLSALPAGAWKRGNQAGDWTKGATVKIAVDTPPGNAAQQAAYLEALAEAMAEWNEAQAAFGGLKLVLTTEANPDVHISWANQADAWGVTTPGKGPVEVTIESDDGINERGATRTLEHELGHVEGLGHSAASAVISIPTSSSSRHPPRYRSLRRSH